MNKEKIIYIITLILLIVTICASVEFLDVPTYVKMLIAVVATLIFRFINKSYLKKIRRK